MSAHETQGNFVVAVGFDRQTDELVRLGVRLAKKFNLAMHMVHVVEPLTYEPMMGDMPGFYVIPGMVAERERTLTVQRAKDLARIRDSFEGQIEMTSKVAVGDPVRMLIEVAETRRSNFILTSCNPTEYKSVLHGFSTALSLMHEAPMPVLAVSAEVDFDLAKPGFKILVADDLCEGTREAVCKAFELAARLPGAAVRQVHVHGDFRELLRDAWQDFKERTPGLKPSESTLDSLWKREYNLRLEQLGKHGEPFRSKAEAVGVTVAFDVRTGGVQEQLHEAITSFAPDLLVFGRHRLLRTRPFLIGRMSARAMLEEGLAVLSVPPTAELFAKLPFPAAAG